MTTSVKKRKNGFLKSDFKEIFICAKNELAPFGTVFVVSAENYEQEKLGTLFGILKVSDFSADSSYVVNLLASVMKKEYFSRPERPSEESFEASLRKANLALAEIARHGSTGWAGKIDFAGGAIERSNLHFSRLGRTSVFLIRSGQIAEISRVLENEKTAEPHPLKTFTDISSGRLEKGDKLIFTTRDLLDIFSPDELRHNAARFSQEEFAGLIEASLRANTEMGGTIIVDFPREAKKADKLVKKPIEFPRPEPESAIVLPKPAPAPIGSGVTISDIFAASGNNPRGGERIHIEEKSRESERESFWNNFIVSFGKYYRIIAKFFAGAIQNFFASYQKLRLKEKTRVLFREKVKPGHFVEKIREHSRYFSGRISGLDSKKRKIFSGAVLAAVLLIIVGVLFYRNSGNEPAPAPENNQSAPQPNPTAPPTLEDINVKNVSKPETIAEISQNTTAAALFGDSLFVIPKNSKTILKIDPNTKSVEEFSSSLGVGNFKLMASMPNLNSIFILTEDKKIVSFTPINKIFQENGIELPAGLNAKSMKAYLTYLYFLDPSANQIYRYPRAEGGFGEKQDWLKAGSDIKNTADFAINDDIFAASEDGINAYLQGKEDTNINFEKTRLPLSIDSICSEPDMEFIYVLDSKNHRVVQYSKDGKISTQYWNESISGIDNFTVDEKNKSVYLIEKNSIDKFSIE
ncbi:MAG: hypothetical protein WC831_05910 [Parcubacteria group bacterium]|jgi:hypothetical protein